MANQRNLQEMKDTITSMLPSQGNVSSYDQNQGNSFGGKNVSYQQKQMSKGSGKEPQGFIQSMTSLFGFKKASASTRPSSQNIEFLKVDSGSEMRIAQAKIAKTFNTKMSTRLSELFDYWLHDTVDSYNVLLDRQKKLNELDFAISADPFLGRAADMYADEATQLDVQGKLIEIECADIRMKEKMEDLLLQWGVTQNRLRSAAYNLASYGDGFWSAKVTPNGVVRINPIGVRQVKERLEFNPVQVQNDIALRKGWVTSINRSEKLSTLFDIIDDVQNEEFADIFDTRLFGFVIEDEMVVPPWSIVHFRLTPEQSVYSPMGQSLFLKALAPFRQLTATMTLQSLARVQSFPVTVYTVKTAPGMDEALQFEKVNQVREEYDLIGESGAGVEAMGVNTKIWAPEGLLTLEMHSPNVDIKATEDIEIYQDRVATASGIPKGYLVQEWGGFGNSAISLIEQFKPFARTVFTIQSAILDGLTNLFRLHFAITGEYDYREDFVLSMKFPNEEASDARQASRQNSLNLSKDVLQTVAQVVGAINDPLPPEIIRDILTKFSFLDPEDIKKWVKKNPNQVEKQEDGMEPEEFGSDMGGGGAMGGGGDIGGGMPDMGGDVGGDLGGGESLSGDLGTAAGGDGMMPGPEEGGMPAANEEPKQESYRRIEMQVLREKKLREIQLIKRYRESEEQVNKGVMREFKKIQESSMNQRHYKFSRVEECNIPMYELLNVNRTPKGKLMETSSSKYIFDKMKQEVQEKKLSWGAIKEEMEATDFDAEPEAETMNYDSSYSDEQREEDEARSAKIKSIIS
jgi:hypothetical protein